MTKHQTPKYIIVFDCKADKPLSWFVQEHGAPNEKNLARFVMLYTKSPEYGATEKPRYAEIRFNYHGGATVAEWKAAHTGA